MASSFDTLCQRPLPCLPPDPDSRSDDKESTTGASLPVEDDANPGVRARSHPARLRHRWLASTVRDLRGQVRSGAAGRLLSALTKKHCCTARAFCRVGDQYLLKDHVSEAFVRLLEASGHSYHVMFPLIREEVDAATSFQMLFRRNTGLTRYLSSYFRLMGRPFLQGILGPTVELVLNSGSLEVNADKAPELSVQRLRLNTFELINVCQGLHDMIIQNLARFPQSLRIVMGRIYQEVERRFPDQGYNVVSSFIFLRFLCPSLLSPKKAGLIDLNPDRPRLRTLVLVSKLLQSLANGACQDVDLKNSPNDECAEFIKNNSEPMREFVILLARPSEDLPTGDIPLPGPPALWACTTCHQVHRRGIVKCRGCHTPAPELVADTLDISSVLEQSASDLAPALSQCLNSMASIPETQVQVVETFTFRSKDRLLAASSDFGAVDSNDKHSQAYFDEFEQAILGNQLMVLQRLLFAVPEAEAETCARAAVSIAMSRGCALELVKRALKDRMNSDAVKSPATLFVPNCLSTHMLDVYVKLSISTPLRSAFKSIVQDAVSRVGDPPPSPGALGGDLPAQTFVHELVTKLLSRYFTEQPSCPPSFRSLLSLIYALVEEVFEGEGDSTVRLFLGHCMKNALREPAAHGILPVILEPAAAATLERLGQVLHQFLCFEEPELQYRPLFEQYQPHFNSLFQHALRKNVSSGSIAKAEFSHLHHRKRHWGSLRRKSLSTLRTMLIRHFELLLPVFNTDSQTEEILYSYSPIDQLVIVLDSIVPEDHDSRSAIQDEETLITSTPTISLASSAASSVFKFGSLDSGIVTP